MNLFKIMLLDLILLVFPLLIYLIYNAYSKTLDLKKNNLFLDCALFSSYYLLLRLGYLNINDIPLLFLDILLVIAYNKKKSISIFILSILLILYYHNIFNIDIYLLTVEYLFYYLLYRGLENKNKYCFVNAFCLLKIMFFGLYIYFSNIFRPYYFVLGLIFLIVSNIVIYLYTLIDNMFSLYIQVKNINKESQINESLFKITHEIKNPIAVCKGYLDMFDVNDMEHYKKYIPILKSEINRVLSLLQDFLTINKIKVEKEEMDLTMLLEDTIICLKPLLNSKKIKLISNINDDEIYINADYNRLKQTLVNIIKNSYEAIEDEGIINIDLKTNKNKAKIIIEDNGVGMSKDELKKIKEAFFTTKKNGNGLGIYMSNEIIKLHNGSLDYSSDGHGTTVTINLPI